MTTPRTFALAAVIGAAMATSLHAHHSYAEYEKRIVTIQGTIEQIQFANPHTILTMRTTDAGVYTGTWRTARQLERDGVTGEHLKPGDVVAVSGHPSRVRPDLSKITEVRRVRDGWAWRMNNDGQISVVAAR
jgi:hypothetical protein